MIYMISLVGLLGLVQPPAQARPLKSPRLCTRATEASVAVDTTLNLEGGSTNGFLQYDGQGGPRYPVALRNAGTQGEVRASFTVDTMGQIVRGSAAVVAESDHGFSQAVCEFLSTARFVPMASDGKRLTVRVTNHRFMFTIGQPRS